MSERTSIVAEDTGSVIEALGASISKLEDTHFLLTGAAGFLGSYLLDVIVALNREASRRPVRVTALDLFETGIPERFRPLEDDPNIRVISHDVTKPFEPDEALTWIVHAASIASPIQYRRSPLATIDVNVNGTWRLLELAERAGAQSFVFLSSSEIYGNPSPEAIPTPEDYPGYVSCTGPRACYDESKRLGETLCLTFHRRHGTPVKIARPFNVYGPRQALDDGRLIPDLMSAALRGDALRILSLGQATRSFCYASDFVTGLLRLMLSNEDGETFNIGISEERSIEEVARIVSRIAADPPLDLEFCVSDDPDYLTDNPDRRCPDVTKMKTRLGWSPQVGLEQGLERTLRHYREVHADSRVHRSSR